MTKKDLKIEKNNSCDWWEIMKYNWLTSENRLEKKKQKGRNSN